jgi:hypothetical protein
MDRHPLLLLALLAACSDGQPHPADRAPVRVLTLAWGAAPDQVGHDAPPEGAPRCVNAVVPTAGGHLLVLDTANRRVVRWSTDKPTAIASTPLPTGWAADLALLEGPETRLAVLDRDVSETVIVLDPEGREVRRVPLAGPAIPEAAGVTALFTRAGPSEGLWVEYDNRWLVRLTDGALSTNPLASPAVLGPGTTQALRDSPRLVLMGRPSPSGDVLITARLTPDGGAKIDAAPPAPRHVLAPRNPGRTFSVALPAEPPIAALHGLEHDGVHTFVLTFHLDPPAATVIAIDRDGRLVARAPVPPPMLGAMPFRPLRASPDGGIVHSACTDEGLVVTRWSP